MPDTTVDVDGFSVTSNHEDADAIRAAFTTGAPIEEPPAEKLGESADEVPEPVAAAPSAEPAPPKIDKRTREGRKLSIQQEIDELTTQKHSTKAEIEAARAELTRLRAEQAALSAQRSAPTREPSAPTPQQTAQDEYKRFMAMPDAPKPDQFPGENGWQDYQYAVNVFVADKRFDERLAATQHAQQITQQQTKFTTRIQAEVAKDAAFQQKLDVTPVDTRIIPYLHQHPQGDEIMVHLVNHPEIAQRLTTLNPIDQIGQIGEIVGALKVRADAASRGPARSSVISNAKPPIKPLGSSPSVSDDGDEADLPIEAFVARGNARDRKVAHR